MASPRRSSGGRSRGSNAQARLNSRRSRSRSRGRAPARKVSPKRKNDASGSAGRSGRGQNSQLSSGTAVRHLRMDAMGFLHEDPDATRSRINKSDRNSNNTRNSHQSPPGRGRGKDKGKSEPTRKFSAKDDKWDHSGFKEMYKKELGLKDDEKKRARSRSRSPVKPKRKSRSNSRTRTATTSGRSHNRHSRSPSPVRRKVQARTPSSSSSPDRNSRDSSGSPRRRSWNRLHGERRAENNSSSTIRTAIKRKSRSLSPRPRLASVRSVSPKSLSPSRGNRKSGKNSPSDLGKLGTKIKRKSSPLPLKNRAKKTTSSAKNTVKPSVNSDKKKAVAAKASNKGKGTSLERRKQLSRSSSSTSDTSTSRSPPPKKRNHSVSPAPKKSVTKTKKLSRSRSPKRTTTRTRKYSSSSYSSSSPSTSSSPSSRSTSRSSHSSSDRQRKRRTVSTSDSDSSSRQRAPQSPRPSAATAVAAETKESQAGTAAKNKTSGSSSKMSVGPVSSTVGKKGLVGAQGAETKTKDYDSVVVRKTVSADSEDKNSNQKSGTGASDDKKKTPNTASSRKTINAKGSESSSSSSSSSSSEEDDEEEEEETAPKVKTIPLSERFAKLAQLSGERREMDLVQLRITAPAVGAVDKKVSVEEGVKPRIRGPSTERVKALSPSPPAVPLRSLSSRLTGSGSGGDGRSMLKGVSGSKDEFYRGRTNNRGRASRSPPPARLAPLSSQSSGRDHGPPERGEWNNRYPMNRQPEPPRDLPRDWDDIEVRHQYYIRRGHFPRDFTLEEFAKWEDWWVRYQQWKRGYERAWVATHGPNVPVKYPEHNSYDPATVSRPSIRSRLTWARPNRRRTTTR